MNAEGWYATKNTLSLVRSAWKETRSPRKVQLLLCGVARLVEKWLPNDVMRGWADLIERFVDGTLSSTEAWDYQFIRIPNDALELSWATPEWRATFVLQSALTYDQKRETIERAIDMAGSIYEELLRDKYSLMQYRQVVCEIIRELYPPPNLKYQHLPNFACGGLLLPDGTTFHIPENAKLIADGIQHDQAFDRLPILADALEDANLTDRPLLDHLRHGTNHRRGCWAFDIIMGRG